MTQPGGGHGNDINLAALWIPVMPETSHMGEEMRKAGGEAKKKFEEGFNSSGSSPEQLGQGFASKLRTSISNEFKGFEIPFGGSQLLEKFSGDLDTKLVSKLQGGVRTALDNYRTQWDALAAAQTRAADVEQRMQALRDSGLNKASLMIPLMQEQTRAQNEVTAAHNNATVALQNYNEKQSALSEEASKAATGSQVLAGILGGAVVAGVGLAVSGVEHLVEAIGEGFKESIELTKELAEKAIELGETYEHVEIQVREFSSASGEEFEKLAEHAQKVFGTLDVAGNDTGKTMAQFAAMLGADAGPALDMLTKHVEELQGRFTTLKASDLAAIFLAFKTPVEETDSALASLLQSARNSGQDLGQLTSALSGDAALTLHEAGLSIQQAGAFMADLIKLGPSGRSVMMGLASAQKEFSKEGLDFSAGMKLAAKSIQDLVNSGDTAGADAMSEKLFGGRRWVEAKAAVEDYLHIVEQGPDAFNSNTSAMDDFIAQTETLGNKVEEFKHKAEDAFKPFGDAAKNAALQGLNVFSNWFEEHRHDIVNTVADWSEKLVNFLPTAKKWAEDAIRIFGDFGQALMVMLAPITLELGTAGAAALALTGHFSDAKDLLEAAAKIPALPIADIANNWADKVRDIKLDSSGIADSIERARDAANEIPPGLGTSAGFSQGDAFNAGRPGMPGSTFNMPGSASAAGTGTVTNDVNGIFSNSAGVGSSQQSDITISSGPEANKQLAQSIFPWPASEWPAFVSLEEHEAGWDATARNSSSGAFGMGQFLGHEHDQYAAGYSPDPATQLRTMFQYIADRYGTPTKAWAQYYQHPKHQGYYQTGGDVGPRGTDTVPAWLTPGEYVWDTQTVDKFGWLIKALHGAKGFQGGGGVPSGSADYAASGAGDDLPGVNQQLQFIDQIAKGFGLTLTAGKSGHGTHEMDGGYHDSGEAGDFSNGMQTDQELAFAMYMIEHYGSELAEVIHTDPRLPKLIKDGKLVDPQAVYGPWLDGHKDHVHIAIKSTQAMSDLSPGTESLSAGLPGMPNISAPGSMPGGNGPRAGYAGMPGQYGGLGAYGGETYDEQQSTANAVRDAKQRADDMDAEIARQQRHIDDLKKQIAETGQPKPGLLPGTTDKLTPEEQKAADDKKARLNEELDDATAALTRSQRERGDQDGKIADAQHKQLEAYYKAPEKAKTQKATGLEAFTQLGGGLLSGIGQELGFGDLFGKAPWEWGIFKLLAGATNWGIGTANAWADEIGKGHTGLTGNQPIAGWDQAGGALGGLFGSLGVNLPKLATQGVSAGPNVSVNPVGTPASGAGSGPAPGPVTIDNSINVQAGVDPGALAAPTQDLRNSQQNSMFQNAGGVPQ